MNYLIFKWLYMKGFFITLVIAFFALAAFYFPEHAPIVIHWIHEWGYIAPIFFLMIYCFATIFFLPTMVLTLAGGALFGPILGTFLNVLSATIGATLAFILSRYWISDWLNARENKSIDKIISEVETRGWQFVALVRLVPVIPFNLVNYALGLTRIKLSHYVITTFVFLIPLEILSTYCGYAGMDFLINSNLLYKQVLLGLGLIAGVVYTIVLVLKKRTQLNRS